MNHILTWTRRASWRSLARLALPLVVLSAGGIVWSATLFQAGDSIPGYVHRNGAGSAVDVRADGTHDGTGWTVVLKRSLATGDAATDIQFTPGGSYAFQVAKWDNAGDELHDLSVADRVYHMVVPPVPGPVVITPGVPTIFTSLTGEYLASDEIRLTATWSDATKNDQRKRWIFDGTDWSQSSENEDRVAFIWDMQSDDFATTGLCTAMCHPPDKMYTNAGRVDTWQWKAARSNPAGYADDKYWDDGQGGTVSGRHGDPGQAPYKDNVGASPPTSMAEGDPGVNANFLFEFPAETKESTAYAAGAWTSGDVLPGYVHLRGSGSNVDIHSTGVHDGTGWTVTYRRKLDTGDAGTDLAFAPGGTYSFQVALWNNSGDEAHNIAEAANVFTMTLPAAPGPLVFSGTPGILTSLSGVLLSSGEVEITAAWSDATRNDVRKQWSFDGAAWSRSSDNEDRITLIWDMQNDGFATTGTCAAMCHLPDKMYTNAGRVDAWHWKATRTGPAGFTDDQYWDDGDAGTVSGRRVDPGTAVFKENVAAGGAPTYMSTAGPGTSARFLFEHAAAAGWSRAVPFVEPVTVSTSTVKSANLKVDFVKDSRDSISISGTYDTGTPPDLSQGPSGTLELGTFSQGFQLQANGKSVKDPVVKVSLNAKNGTWTAKVKNTDLKAGLGLGGDGGWIPQDLTWRITLDNGWRVTGTVTMTGTVSLTYNDKTGAKIRGKYKLMR